ncbi:hypothetical protein [Sphingomonas sp.]|jgi:hypothetical protein|uniref:hypothetical protein n=1 Tax=Sphingomonas sp. TaxID=28214 RepID=UPI002D80B39A|nr:hypothetical protein [Sphingomonas sp.]HEU0045018.1 hypothetical protein [Sphingomonas sp.]
MKTFVPLIAMLLSGCATADAGYPSLAPRAVEKTGFDEPAASAAPAVVAADPALDARLAEIATKLAAVIAGYDADAAHAERASRVAGARTVGSDAWLNAQTALAALDDWRAQATALTTDAEVLASDRIATIGTPYPALEALQARAAAETQRQTTGIAALSARLPMP